MATIKLTRGLCALVDDSDLVFVARFKWNAALVSGGLYYARRGGGGTPQIYLHRLLCDAPEGLKVDHRNGNTLDNQRSNLRICSTSENARNAKLMTNNLIGFKGVSRFRNGFQASIRFEGKTIYLGVFENPIDAAQSYDEGARKYFGEFARTNKTLGLM